MWLTTIATLISKASHRELLDNPFVVCTIIKNTDISDVQSSGMPFSYWEKNNEVQTAFSEMSDLLSCLQWKEY